jgi:cysteine-rich repeat protein
MNREFPSPWGVVVRQSGFIVTILFAVCLAGACEPAHLPGGGGDGDGGLPGVCGDLKVTGDEECDDGNRTAGDGCDAECKVDIPDGCGDDILEGTEECDDGNNEPGDGCGKSCKIERCGNGVRDPGEACEDNNVVGGDGCSADCKSDESCGNGILDPGESCDDGNNVDGDACPRSCQPATCGDGFVQRGPESCDDQNDVAGDGCTGCILDTCGNGAVDPGEDCDLGAGNGTAGRDCFRSCISTTIAMAPPVVTPLDPTENFAFSPLAVEAADLDGDGRLDVAVVDPGAASVIMAYGFGDGRLWPPRSSSLAGTGTGIALADLNGDGKLDVVVSRSDSTIGVLLGADDGFGPEQSFSTLIDIGGTGPRGLAIAELTGDGKLDVVTANVSSSDVTLLVGDGAGGFVAQARLGTTSGEAGVGPVDVAVADVTGDGVLDVVTANQSTSDVSVIPGLGNGNFGAAVVHSTAVGAGGAQPIAIVIADVSNDGRRDIITANAGSDDVTVLAGTAGGGLAAPVRFVTLAGGKGAGPRGLAVGDVDGDGRRDIVTVNNSDDVAILTAVGVGVAFNPVSHVTLRDEALPDEVKQPVDVAIADLDRDGKADLVVANRSSSDLTVLRGTGGGQFAAGRSFEVGDDFGGRTPLAMAIGDVNRDGHRDAVVLGNRAVLSLAGLGDGRLARPQALSVSGSGHPAFGDLDGDGRIDVVVPRGAFIQLAMQRPSGAFQSRFNSSSELSNAVAVAIGNTDGDPALELAAADLSNLRLAEWDNDGAGGPISVAFLTTGGAPQHVALGDVTGDGQLDLVAAIPGANEIRISAGNGAGGFASPAGLTTSAGASGREPFFVTVADLDGDGKADICTANAGSNDVTVLLGEGSGAFGDPIISAAVLGAGAAEVSVVRVGDLNGDGVPDLVTANPGRGTISVLIGFGNGGFAAPQSFPVGTLPHSIAVGDFDGDGLDDVAAIVSEPAAVVILRSKGHP